VAGAALAAPATATAVTAPERAARYLERAQNPDGGFGSSPGSSTSPPTTAWTALGLAAAGRPASDALRATLRAQADASTRTGDLERSMIALRAVGEPVPDAVRARLLATRTADGSIGGEVTLTAFGIFALRDDAAVVRPAADWLSAQQNADGGFGYAIKGTPSGSDETAAAVNALVVAGRPASSPTVRRAVAWLTRRQRPDGGWPLRPGATSNAQSTAWVVQALVAAGRDPAKVRRRGSRSPLGYLRSLQAPDGSVRYSRTGRQTPVWVTAQALLALLRQPF